MPHGIIDLRNGGLFMNNKQIVREFIHSNPRQAYDIISRLFEDDEAARDELLYDFKLWARPEQLFDVDSYHDTFLLLAGRGWGKSRWLSQHIIDNAISNPNKRIGLMAPDYKVLKKVSFMGDSGIIQNLPPSILKHKDFHFNKQELSIEFPNGSIISSYSAEAFDKTRGDQFHDFYVEELAAWMYADDAFEACQLTNRLEYRGNAPRTFIATTPRPIKIIRSLANDKSVKVVTGTTYQNYFLSPSYVKQRKEKMSNRMFRQECLAEILDDNPYALFKMSDIEKNRVNEHPPLRRIIVAVDPAVTSNPDSDETGIIVAGLTKDLHVYILEDASMGEATPEEWSAKAVEMYRKWDADRIVAEVNNGGDLVSSVIRTADRSLPPCKIVRASKGKAIRAEPVSAYYEHNEVHHVGTFPLLESQMTEWNPTEGRKSPDRLDALVWACIELLDKHQGEARVSYGDQGDREVPKKNKYTSYG